MGACTESKKNMISFMTCRYSRPLRRRRRSSAARLSDPPGPPGIGIRQNRNRPPKSSYPGMHSGVVSLDLSSIVSNVMLG